MDIVDPDFMAELESLAAEWEAQKIFVCAKVNRRTTLLSEITEPDFLKEVCTCWFSRATQRYGFTVNDKNHRIHIDCGKVSRYSIFHYCVDCNHIYIDDRTAKGVDTVNGMLCPCCDKRQ